MTKWPWTAEEREILETTFETWSAEKSLSTRQEILKAAFAKLITHKPDINPLTMEALSEYKYLKV